MPRTHAGLKDDDIVRCQGGCWEWKIADAVVSKVPGDGSKRCPKCGKQLDALTLYNRPIIRHKDSK